MGSTMVVARDQHPGLKELMDNEEYASLMRDSEALVAREDSISRLVNEARSHFAAMRDTLSDQSIDRENYANYILDLEQQIFELRSRRGAITNRINLMEQEWVLAQLSTPTTQPDTLPQVEESPAEEPQQRVTRRYLTDNDCFSLELDPIDYADLRRAQQEESEMESLVKKYTTTYSILRKTREEYLAADNENTANELFDRFNNIQKQLDDLDTEMHFRWNHILDTKYYAYGYLLEKRHRYDLLDKAAADFSAMQQECARNDGLYSSDDLMHYAIGRPTLLEHEIEFARDMDFVEAADSLQMVRDSLLTPNYKLEPLTLERRLFIDYRPITVGRSNFYNSSNPVEKLKVYERGTIYRILLGKFRTKQPMTLFKGVQPLMIDYNKEEELYYYYVGGFATRLEADEAQLFLLEKGFKAPEICRWHNGEMINITQSEEHDQSRETIDIPVVGTRYVVHIASDTLDDDVRKIIGDTAAGKMITRTGNGFVVGTFASRQEADLLISALTESHPMLSASIAEIELK